MQSDADQAITEDRRLLDQLFWLATTASSARELRTYGITGPLAERHRELSERVRRRAVHAALLSALWEGLGWLVFALGLVAAIVALVLRAAHGHISPGSVVMAVTLMRRAQTQISRSTDTAGSFATSVSAARELLWLEDHERASRRAGVGPEPRSPARLVRGISIRRLEFTYPGGDGEPALGPLDLELPAGTTVALVGENGAGKTTLVKLLCGMYRRARAGSSSTGLDLAELDPAAWRARISAAFQDSSASTWCCARASGVGDLERIEELETVRDALNRSDSGALEARLADGLQTLSGLATRRARAVGRTVAASRARARADAGLAAAGRARRADRERRRAERERAVRALRRGARGPWPRPTGRSRCWSRTGSRPFARPT